jgi:hypothetical protein
MKNAQKSREQGQNGKRETGPQPHLGAAGRYTSGAPGCDRRPTRSDQVRPKKYEYDPKRQNRTSAQGRPGTGQPPAGEGRFRSADLPSALDTRTTNTTVTNPAVARRSDAQSRSETGAPADASNNFGRHGPEVEAGNLSGHRPGLSGYIRVNPAIENYK